MTGENSRRYRSCDWWGEGSGEVCIDGTILIIFAPTMNVAPKYRPSQSQLDQKYVVFLPG